jgi:putative ABC transport system substrate-binding protein
LRGSRCLSISGDISSLSSYVDKVLKGAKPADFSGREPSNLELVVNLKTAKALALVIPESFLVHVDEVIE